MMAHRYKIRAFEAPQSEDRLKTGLILSPLDRCFALLASSLDDAERLLCENVRRERLTGGRVYQICPQVDNPEPIRSIAICRDAKSRRVLLDAGSAGPYSERKSLRFLDEDLHCYSGSTFSGNHRSV